MHSKTWGYHLLENCFRSVYLWPTSKGLRRYGALILTLINILWGGYPLVLKLKNINTKFESVFFDIELLCAAIQACAMPIIALTNKNHLFKVINRLSNFKYYGVPDNLKPIEKKLKIATKFFKLLIFTVLFLLLKEGLSDKSCINQSTSNNCHFIVEYYMPFYGKRWLLILMALFQMFSFYLIAMNSVYGILFYVYTIELLMIRLEDLIKKIKEIRLTVGQKNSEKLTFTIKYHQHITCLFNDVTKLINGFVGLKILLLLMVALSAVGIASKHYLSGIAMFIMTTISVLTAHIIGQRIINKSSCVFDAIYDLNWYDADISIQKDILIFLGASQQPLIIKVSLFGSFANSTMADEAKKIYAWFNWIMQFMFKRVY